MKKRFDIADLLIAMWFTFVLTAGFFGYLGASASIDGKIRAAKIALSDTKYRIEEVRGSCEDVFDADECAKCHDLED